MTNSIFEYIGKQVGDHKSPTIGSLSKHDQKLCANVYSQFIRQIEIPKEYQHDMFVLLFQLDIDRVTDLCVKHIRVVKLLLGDPVLIEQLAQELESLYGYTRASKTATRRVRRPNRTSITDYEDEA